MPPKKETTKSVKSKRKKTTKQKTNINPNQLFVSSDLKEGPKLYEKKLLTEENSNINIVIDVDYNDKINQKDSVLYYKTLFKKILDITDKRNKIVNIIYE